ncbi:MAG: hypothetical protein ACREMK_04215 [Gemmatimonadota bacterium]
MLPLACGGDGYGGGPTDPGNGDTDIRGSYTAIHEFTLSIGTIGDSFECPGSLTITILNNGQFTGQISVEATSDESCEDASTPFSGTVSSSGAVEVPVTPEDIEALSAIFAELGCVIVSSDEAFTGTFNGTVITVSFSADLECEGIAGDVTFTYGIEATRIS